MPSGPWVPGKQPKNSRNSESTFSPSHSQKRARGSKGHDSQVFVLEYCKGDFWRKKGCPMEDATFFLTVGSFLLTAELFLLVVDNFSFITYNWSFFHLHSTFFTCNWSFFTYNGKVLLISALRDCKQRSLTVSKEAPAVSKKAPTVSKKNFPPLSKNASPLFGPWAKDRRQGDERGTVRGSKWAWLHGRVALSKGEGPPELPSRPWQKEQTDRLARITDLGSGRSAFP